MTPLTEEEMAKRPLDPVEAAEFLRIGRSTMMKLLRSGEIRAKKVGGQWRIPMEALQAYLNEPPQDK